MVNAFETSDRYAFGLNIDLPGDWHGNIYYSQSYDNNRYQQWARKTSERGVRGTGVDDTGDASRRHRPRHDHFCQAATVPYLNLFCDPRCFTCNSPDTIRSYVTGYRVCWDDKFLDQNEKGGKIRRPAVRCAGGNGQGGCRGQLHDLQRRLFNRTTPSANQPYPCAARFRAIQGLGGIRPVNIPVVGD